MKTYLVTGVCGFIGSNLAIRLLNSGNKVVGIDKKSDRHHHILSELLKFDNFNYYNVDLSNYEDLANVREDVDFVYHLAANADIRFSHVYPEKDLNDGIISTYNMVRWMREREVKRVAYSSTSAIYGDASVVPTPEDYSPIQTSFYGAAKVAGEALIQAHCAASGSQAWVFRYVSITGPRYSHGFIYNFFRELNNNPNELYVHGGQDQLKSYLDVDDCLDAMLTIVEKGGDVVNTYNIGNTETIGLPRSIPIITKYMGIDPKIVWSGNDVGWIGDSKVNHLDVSKLMSLGWKPKYSIEQTIIRTLDWLSDNKWILDVRKEK